MGNTPGTSKYDNSGTARETSSTGSTTSTLYLAGNLLIVAGGGGGSSPVIRDIAPQDPQARSYASNDDRGNGGELISGISRYLILQGGDYTIFWYTWIHGGLAATGDAPGLGGTVEGEASQQNNGLAGNGQNGGDGVNVDEQSSFGYAGSGAGGGSGAITFWASSSPNPWSAWLPAGGGGGSNYIDSSVQDSSSAVGPSGVGSVDIWFS